MFGLLAVLAVTSGCMIVHANLGLWDSDDQMYEHRVLGPHKAASKVLMMDIAGLISTDTSSGFLGGHEPSLPERVRETLEAARKDDTIKALLLRINSPGGGITATDIIFNELERYKEDKDIPVVACLTEMAASGGYYLACASDRIVAHPTSLTGAIGVIANAFNLEELLDKVGVEHVAMKSGDKKDMGSLFRTMTEEEKAIFESIIDDSQQRFLEVVDAGRPNLDRDQVLALADGRVFSATQAKEAGLVDELGYLENAFETAKRVAELDDAALVIYSHRDEGIHNLYSPTASAQLGASTPGGLQQQLLQLLKTSVAQNRAPLLYVWPGAFGTSVAY